MTLQPQKSLKQLQKPANEKESTILIGSPSRGVYVAKKNVITGSRLYKRVASKYKFLSIKCRFYYL